MNKSGFSLCWTWTYREYQFDNRWQIGKLMLKNRNCHFIIRFCDKQIWLLFPPSPHFCIFLSNISIDLHILKLPINWITPDSLLNLFIPIALHFWVISIDLHSLGSGILIAPSCSMADFCHGMQPFCIFPCVYVVSHLLPPFPQVQLIAMSRATDERMRIS